eukprot:322283_1
MKLHVSFCIILLITANTISTHQITFDNENRNSTITLFVPIEQDSVNSPYQSNTLPNRRSINELGFILPASFVFTKYLQYSLISTNTTEGDNLNITLAQIVYFCVCALDLLLYIMLKKKNMEVVPFTIISLSLFIIKTSAETLDTTMNGGNTLNGNMFDICALSNVEITRFDINCYAEGPSVPIEIYVANSVTQVYSAISNTPSAWTKIHTETVTCQPKGTLTILNSFNQNAVSVKILENNCRGFYITRTDAGTLSYTAGSAEGAVYALNADIQFKEGIGVSYPFGDEFTPRIWNGRIHYILFITTNPTLSPTIFTNNPSFAPTSCPPNVDQVFNT